MSCQQNLLSSQLLKQVQNEGSSGGEHYLNLTESHEAYATQEEGNQKFRHVSQPSILSFFNQEGTAGMATEQEIIETMGDCDAQDSSNSARISLLMMNNFDDLLQGEENH